MPASERPSPARRADLLRVQTGSSIVPANPEAMLRELGFQVSSPSDAHWVVTGADPLPEFHFYSPLELGRFALHQARHYQQWLNWREHRDKTADLPG